MSPQPGIALNGFAAAKQATPAVSNVQAVAILFILMVVSPGFEREMITDVIMKRRHCEERSRSCEEHSDEAGRSKPLCAMVLDWLTGDVLSPALRAHFVRPKSLPAILSLRSQ
jgi:hypothetical protein